MKKVVGLLAILFTAAFLPSVSANEKPSIAIIDTAIDTSKVNIAYEVCILYEARCPNKSSFMEGPGAATVSAPSVYLNGFEHGTIMSLIANKINPNANIIFIRIAGISKTGTMYSFSDLEVTKALDWAIANKTKYNINTITKIIITLGFDNKLLM